MKTPKLYSSTSRLYRDTLVPIPTAHILRGFGTRVSRNIGRPTSFFLCLVAFIGALSSCGDAKDGVRVADEPLGFKFTEHPEVFTTEGVEFGDVFTEFTINSDTRQVFRMSGARPLVFNPVIFSGGKIRFSYGISGEAFRYGREITLKGEIVQGDFTWSLGEATINTRGSGAKKGWLNAEWDIPSEITGAAKVVFSVDGIDEGAPDGIFLLAHPTMVNSAVDGQPTRIIWIAADTLRADHLRCYGYDRRTSPNIDAFAEDATIFERCISTCPWTFPSFGAMFTGRYPSVAGAVTNVMFLPDEEATISEILSSRDVATFSVVNSPWVGRMTNLHQGFDACKLYQHLDAGIAFNTASDWLKLHPDEDVFVFIHLMDPHLPYEPKKEHLGKFGPAGYAGEYASEFDMSDLEIEGLRAGQFDLSDEDKARIEALYDEEIFGMDQDFQVFIDSLKAGGFFDDSMIIFNADHGEEFWEHGGFEHGHQLYDEVIHVPLIIKGGGFPKGERIEGLCSNIDILPTVLDWTSIPAPGELNAHNLYNLLDPEWEPEKRYLLSEQLYYGVEQKGVSTDQYRYILHTLDEFEELYDFDVDPVMLENVADDRRKTSRKFRYFAKEFILNSMSGWHMRFARTSSTVGGKSYEVVISAPGGFANYEGHGLDENDLVRIEGDSLMIDIRIDAAGEKLVNFSTPDEDVEVSFDIRIDGGAEHLDLICLGPGLAKFPQNRFSLRMDDERFGLGIPNFRKGQQPGLTIWGNSLELREELTPDIDDDIREELKSLGYLQ